MTKHRLPVTEVSASNDYWDNIVDYLKREEIVDENSVVTTMTLSMEAGDTIAVSDIKTLPLKYQ